MGMPLFKGLADLGLPFVAEVLDTVLEKGFLSISWKIFNLISLFTVV